jgi:hypothetical protein
MAEDVAPRVAGAEALPPELRERVERAAARFGSIHQRWSTVELSEPAAPPSEETGDGPGEDSARATEDDARPLAGDAVSVTPILGVDTEESEEAGRPRFKTLMGVPRSSPDLDELAGLESRTGPQEAVRREERSATQPPAAVVAAERPRARVDEAPSLAGTSLPSEPGAPPASSPVSPGPWPSLAQSSLDVSAEVAALRTASRRRPWWVGLGTIAAATAFLAIAAPHQRKLALRWLEGEYRARLRPTAAAAISDTARALRPASSAATPPLTLDRAVAQLESPIAVPPQAMAEPVADPPGARAVVSAAGGSAEDSSEGAAAATNRPSDELAREIHGLGAASHDSTESADVAVPPASPRIQSGAQKGKQTARDAPSGGTTTRARAHVAAARKPSQRDDKRQTSSATKLAARATKARGARQNTPRKDSGSGIIRETPF